MTKLTEEQRAILKRQAAEQVDMQIRHSEERQELMERQKQEREEAKIDGQPIR